MQLSLVGYRFHWDWNGMLSAGDGVVVSCGVALDCVLLLANSVVVSGGLADCHWWCDCVVIAGGLVLASMK